MNNDQAVFFKQVLPGILASGNPIIARSELQTLCDRAGIRMPNAATQVKPSRGMLDLSHLVETAETITGTVLSEPVNDERTDEEIHSDTEVRFRALDRMAFGIASGKFRAMIVSGDPGIGKTYNLESVLEGAAHREEIIFTEVKGYVKPTGIYRLLWDCREPGNVLMFDDADSVFGDDIGLNLLKGALDTTKKRVISWMSEKEFETEDGTIIPRQFEFKGAAIFVTNLNFDREIMRSNKNTPHLAALISRSFYLDLNMSGSRELMLRIKHVVRTTEMLINLSKDQQEDVISYMEANQKRLRELSLRMALKLGDLLGAAQSKKDFNAMANATCLRR